MRSISIHMGLLWKEWIQNRFLIMIAFLALGYIPILGSLEGIVFKVKSIIFGTVLTNQWSGNIARMVDPSGSKEGSVALVGMIACILLGVLLLSNENQGSLKYLVSTPVSRKEIILAKYLIGAGSLITIMSLNCFFMVIGAHMSPADYTIMSVLQWTALFTVTYFAIFSIGFMVSCFINNSLLGFFICYFLLYMPQVLLELLRSVLSQFEFFSLEIYAKCKLVIDYLTIPFYLKGPHHFLKIVDQEKINIIIPTNYPIEALGLLLAAMLFLFFAIQMFKRNPFEEDNVLIFPFTGKLVHIFCSIFLGLILTGLFCSSKILFLVLFPTFSVIVYFLIQYIYFLVDRYELKITLKA